MILPTEQFPKGPFPHQCTRLQSVEERNLWEIYVQKLYMASSLKSNGLNDRLAAAYERFSEGKDADGGVFQVLS